MVSIYFVGTYPPIMCGIADYTSFITRQSPAGRWGVISFDLEKYGAPLAIGEEVATDRVWYGIPGRNEFSASMILEGLKTLGAKVEDAVLWFQHEDGIWPDSRKFIAMLKGLDMPKVVTFHTLHFQNAETPCGLRKYQYDLLRNLLPHVEAITVFSGGVYWAVISAFPEYCTKVYIIKHGIHSYPEVSSLSRKEAKDKLNDFLLYESDLEQATKEALHRQRIFLDPDTVVLGETGFLCPLKQSESLYLVRDILQKVVPHQRIVAVRIGSHREASHAIYAEQLRKEQNGKDKFLLEAWLPRDILPLAQRAFDINLHWPSECTQSGVLAHALGAGAVIAGRDLEGAGEILKEAGQLADTDIDRLIMKIKNLIANPELRERIEESTLIYATEYSWENQALRHYELAKPLLYTKPLWTIPYLPRTISAIAAPVADRMKLNAPIQN